MKQHLKWKTFHVPSYDITLVIILKAIIFILSNAVLDFCYLFFFFINIFQKMKSVVEIIGMEKN